MPFYLFGSLPTEIRCRIWQLTIDLDPEPEVCLPWPFNLEHGYGKHQVLERLPVLPLTVDLPFPVAMHVCSEARSHTLNTATSGVRFRSSSLAGCLVPFREFMPDLDTLYIGGEAFHLLNAYFGLQLTGPPDPEDDQHLVGAVFSALYLDGPTMRALNVAKNKAALHAWEEMLLKCKYIAIQGAWQQKSSIAHWIYHQVWERLATSFEECDAANLPPFPDVTFLYVAPASTPFPSSHDWQLRFKQPARRCRLVPLSLESQRSIVHASLASAETASEYLPLPECMEVALLRISETLDGTPEEIAYFQNNLKLVPATFEERQKDGQWVEVCKDRVFSPYKGHHCSFSSGPAVQLADRPDPTKERPLDIDDGLYPWVDLGLMVDQQLPQAHQAQASCGRVQQDLKAACEAYLQAAGEDRVEEDRNGPDGE